jgi:hypothetical protein
MTHSDIGKANGNDALFRFRGMAKRTKSSESGPAGDCRVLRPRAERGRRFFVCRQPHPPSQAGIVGY